MNEVEPTPLVSVVIPSFNHGPYVQACIEGVLAQEYRNIELIVIDDGSTDDSVARIREMIERCCARFKRFEFIPRHNKGLCETLNEALEWAQGEYFAVTDSDDVLLPSKTSVLLANIINAPAVVGVFGGCQVINADGAVLREIRPKPVIYKFSDILNRNKVIFSSCMLVRLDSMRSAGGYLNGLYIEDWYMWLKLTENGSQLKVIDEPLIQYRQHGTNISKDAFKMFHARKAILDMFSQYQEVPKVISLICLELSIELSRINKMISLEYVGKALMSCPAIVFKTIFWGAFARLLTPTAILIQLTSSKNHFQRKIQKTELNRIQR